MSAPTGFRFAAPNLLSASPRADPTPPTDLSTRRSPAVPLRDGTSPQPPPPPSARGLYERQLVKPASAGDLTAPPTAPVVKPTPVVERRTTQRQQSPALAPTISFDELIRQRTSLEANASALVVQQEARIKALVR